MTQKEKIKELEERITGYKKAMVNREQELDKQLQQFKDLLIKENKVHKFDYDKRKELLEVENGNRI